MNGVGHFLFRKISHPTCVTFETASSLAVVEPFIDLWTPKVFVFMIALHTYFSSTSTLVNFTGKVSLASLNKAP